MTTEGQPRVIDRLRAGQPVRALGLRLSRNPDVVRIAAHGGWDAVWIDLEHSTMGMDACAGLCGTARDLGLEAWVRIPDGDFGAVGRVLDGGAHGVIFPGIATPEEAARAAALCRYAPEGVRSQNAFTPATRFRPMPAAARSAAVNAGITVQVLLETPEAIARAGEIAGQPGVDVVSLGLNDLSTSMGFPGQPDAPEVMAAAGRAIAAVAGAGKLAVIGGARGPEQAARLVAMGAAPYLFAAIDTELVVEALAARLDRWSAAFAPPALEAAQ